MVQDSSRDVVDDAGYKGVDGESSRENGKFDDEYAKVCGQAAGVVTLIDDMTTSLEAQRSYFKGRTLQQMYDSETDFERLTTTTVRASKILEGRSGKFLVDDLTSAMAALRDSLAGYSFIVNEKIAEEFLNEDYEPALPTLDNYVDHIDGELDRIKDELHELELYQSEIEETVNIWSDDPKQWPPYIYELNSAAHNNDDDDDAELNIGCVVRVSPDTDQLSQDQLQCNSVDWRHSRYPVGDNEEIVSTVVCLKPTNGVDMHFKSCVWVALPYVAIPRGREAVIRVQSAGFMPPTRKSPSPDLIEELKSTSSEVVENNGSDERQQNEKEDDGEGATDTEAAARDAPTPVTETPATRGQVKHLSHLPAAAPQPPAEWRDVITRETTIDGQDFRFVETPIRDLDGYGINIVVLTRPKRDIDQWNNRGGRLVSSIDQRVSVAAPKNAFRLSTDVTLQLIVIDSAALSGLKERYDGCDVLLGASPLVCFTASNKPQKPLVYSVTNPSGGSKKPKAGTAPVGGKTSGGGASTSLPKTNAAASVGRIGGRDQDDIDDVVNLVVKDSLGRWRHRDNVKIEQQRDCIVFQLNELVHRLILLRTPPSVDPVDLCRLAGRLESSLAERPAQLVVRQRDDDPCSVFIELCRRDTVDKLINSDRLKRLQFTEGPEPSRIISLREGDLVEMSFRENIVQVTESHDGTTTLVDSTHQFLYNSNLPSLNAQLIVRERSVFAQNALDVYRGYVRLCLVERPYQPPPKLAGPSGISAVAAAANAGSTAPAAAAGGGAKKVAQPAGPTGKPVPPAIDKNLVCEIMLTLPKPPKEVARIKRIDVSVSPAGPLTAEYYEQLAESLGDDWVRLAKALGLGQPAVPRIVRNYAHLDNTSDCNRQSAKEALIQWHRSSTKSSSKVEDLKQALVDAGRNDLAEDLGAKNKEYRKEIDKKHEEERLRKSMKIFLDSVAAVRAWREVGRDLRLTHEDLESIGGPATDAKHPSKKTALSVEAKGHAEQMLRKWMETSSEEASTGQLIAVLKKRKLNETAANMLVVK